MSWPDDVADTTAMPHRPAAEEIVGSTVVSRAMARALGTQSAPTIVIDTRSPN